MASVNKVILVGRLGKDPEVKYTQNGVAVASFSLATDEQWKNKEGEKQQKTTWHNLVLWDKLAEIAGQYLIKGQQIYAEGKLQTRKWEDKDGNTRYTTEIVIANLVMLGSKSDNEDSSDEKSARKKAAPKKSEPQEDGLGVGDDDIPF